jgi:hypothetical protein
VTCVRMARARRRASPSPIHAWDEPCASRWLTEDKTTKSQTAISQRKAKKKAALEMTQNQTGAI